MDWLVVPYCLCHEHNCPQSWVWLIWKSSLTQPVRQKTREKASFWVGWERNPHTYTNRRFGIWYWHSDYTPKMSCQAPETAICQYLIPASRGCCCRNHGKLSCWHMADRPGSPREALLLRWLMELYKYLGHLTPARDHSEVSVLCPPLPPIWFSHQSCWFSDTHFLLIPIPDSIPSSHSPGEVQAMVKICHFGIWVILN